MRMIIRADDVGFTDVCNIGTFETMTNGVVTSADVMLESPGTVDALNRLKVNAGDTEALAALLGLLGDTAGRGFVLLKNALKMLPSAVSEFEKSWDELMKLIYKANPDVDVLVIGQFNPVDDAVKFTVENKLSADESLKTVTDTAA